ncbi:hypothetical protein J4210_04415 [Candidatus Woesearchaeota archaeon]|nr:hypothetical protein [Candidatus Woesearchaeota archaeon]
MDLDSLVSAFKMGRRHFTHGAIIDDYDSCIEEVLQLPDTFPVSIAYFAGAATHQPLDIAFGLYALGKDALQKYSR